VTGSQNPNCIQDCQATRLGTLGASDIGLFSAAEGTCEPLNIDECAQAQAMAENCLVQYNYKDYEDPNEALAVYAEYSACYLASKVDACR
jgi:hypothetical protein